jgi:16S rRNA (cytidine1402-2'-O)-methyltransferase
LKWSISNLQSPIPNLLLLYLIATPIGNLGDMSQRAIDTLRSADVIAAEDTRHTGMLLHHFGIEGKRLAQYHEHNEDRAAEKLIALAAQGHSVAVCTDAGTPGIADPGFTLVRSAIEQGVAVTMIPGAAAFVMALVLSGLPSHSFTFRGFPPRTSAKRQKFFAVDVDSPHTLIYYESPFRVRECLQDALAVFGDRAAALANDLTKMFERVDRGSLSQLLAGLGEGEKHELKGEYVLVVEGATTKKSLREVNRVE